MSSGVEALGNAVRADHVWRFRAAMAQGLTKPPVFPYVLLGTFFIPGIYLAIPHTNRPWLYQLRWAVMALIVAFNAKMMADTSGANPAMAFGTGLYACWGIMNCFSAIIWKSPQFESERVLKVRVDRPGEAEKDKGGTMGGPVQARRGRKDAKAALANGDGVGEWRGYAAPDLKHGSVKTAPGNPDILLGEEGYEYYWEPFPADAPFSHRFNWAMDLVTNLRGEGRLVSHSRQRYPLRPASNIALARMELRDPDYSSSATARSPGVVGTSQAGSDSKDGAGRVRQVQHHEGVSRPPPRLSRPSLRPPRCYEHAYGHGPVLHSRHDRPPPTPLPR